MQHSQCMSVQLSITAFTQYHSAILTNIKRRTHSTFKVDPGELAPDQSNPLSPLSLSLRDCLPLISFLHFLWTSASVSCNWKLFKSLLITSFQVFLSLPLDWMTSPHKPNIFLPNHPHPFLRHAYTIFTCFVTILPYAHIPSSSWNFLPQTKS